MLLVLAAAALAAAQVNTASKTSEMRRIIFLL
jgi:hypothetical protein